MEINLAMRDLQRAAEDYGKARQLADYFMDKPGKTEEWSADFYRALENQKRAERTFFEAQEQFQKAIYAMVTK